MNQRIRYLSRSSALLWLVGFAVIVAVSAGLLMLSSTPAVGADQESEVPLNCLTCHTRVLTGHDILGSGNQACWICHDNTDMEMLHLTDQTVLSSRSSSQVCGQCHQGYYNAWLSGGHGTLTVTGVVGCTDCHDPHQPHLVPEDKSEITEPPVIESETPLDCLNCHTRVLRGHDKLGTGSEACWACHYSTEMTTLHLAGGATQFPLSEFPRLCAQCHQERYEAWEEGIHGVPTWTEAELAEPDAEKAKCINCHEPHQPQIALLNITQPHPLPEPAPPSLPTEPLIVLGISLFIVIVGGIVLVRGGQI
jgi:hypothetical protein